MATTKKAPPKPVAKKAPAKKVAAAPAKAPTKAELAAEAKAAKAAAAEKEARKNERAAAAQTKRDEAEAARQAKRDANEATKAEVARLRGEGSKWEEVAEALGISVGKAQLLGAIAGGEAAGTKKATSALVVRDRDEKKMGWVQIAVQYGITKAQVQKLYRESGKDPHKSYIGGGGRYFSHEADIAPQRAAIAAAKPKVAPKERAAKGEAPAPSGSPVFAADASKESVSGKIDGKLLTLSSGLSFRVKAGSVKVGTNKGVRVVQVTDAKTGGTRTIKLEAIVKVTK